jgi:branched-chain amino acid transport system substrate-binding protein
LVTSVAISIILGLPTIQALQAKENFVLIGQSEPLTGPWASHGIGNNRMMELVAEEINKAGGVKVRGVPYKLKVVCEDNKNTTEGTVAAVNKLVYKEGVKFVTHFPSTPSVASQVVTEPAKVINMVTGMLPEILGPKKPYTFRHLVTPNETSPMMIKWILKNLPNVKSCWMTQADDASGVAVVSAWNAASKKHGMKVLGFDYISRGVTDFYPILSKVLAQSPDLIGATSADQGALLLKQARELGFKGQFAVPLALSSTYASVAGAANVEGTLHIGPDPESELTPKPLRDLLKRYVQKYKENYGSYVAWETFPPYILAQAIEKAGTVDDVDKIKAVMEKEWFETPWGRVRYGGEKIYGVPHQIIHPVFISTLAGGKVRVLERIDPPEIEKALNE